MLGGSGNREAAEDCTAGHASEHRSAIHLHDPTRRQDTPATHGLGAILFMYRRVAEQRPVLRGARDRLAIVVAVRLFVVGLVLLGTGVSVPAAAWPDLPPPSTLEAPPCTTYESIHPVTTEWTMWLGAGAAGVRNDGDASGTAIDAAFVARAGAGLSFGPNVPSHSTGFELRVGPWLGAEAQRRAALGEGGLELALAPEHGGLAVSLRAGGGYGSGAADAQIGRAVFGSLTLTIGLRGPPMAFRRMGNCPTDEAMKVDWNRHARVVRLFAGARAFAGEDRGPTFVAGLEMDPSLLFPDYSKQRWMGSQPTDTVWTWWLERAAARVRSGLAPGRSVRWRCSGSASASP